MKNKIKNESGFSHIILPIFLVLALVTAALFTFNRTRTAGDPHLTSLLSPATNYNVSFYAKSQNDFTTQYLLTAYLNDSFDSKNGCPALSKDFKSVVKIDYISDSKANMTILQDVKNEDKSKTDSSTHICPTVAISPASKTISIDKNWIASGSSTKTVYVNGKQHQLVVDKKARTLTYDGEDKKETVPYLPDGLADLSYIFPGGGTCPQLSELQAYARTNGIIEADSVYPNITNVLSKTSTTALRAPDGSQNTLIVIVDNSVRQLVEKTRKHAYDPEINCQVSSNSLAVF